MVGGTLTSLDSSTDTALSIPAEALLAGQKRALELIAGDASIDQILDYLVRFIEASAPGLRASVLILEGDRLRYGAAPSLPDEYNRAIDGVVIGPAVGSCGSAACAGTQIIVPDIANDPRWIGYAELALSHGLRACWSTPIFSRRGEVLGTFALYYSVPREPYVSEQRLVQVATHIAGIALERFRADEAMKQRSLDLVAADRRKDEFLATLGHELRNPLAPIVTALELMRLRADDPKAVERYRELISRHVQHLGRLVDDLLDVSRITRGNIVIKRERSDMTALIEWALESSRGLIAQRGHRVTVDIRGAPLEVVADPVRLTQVLSNLLNNAAKYTDPGGEISLSAGREGEAIRISVRDSGIGIPAELIGKIFEPFVQANHAGDRARGGLGVGLTLVRRIVDLHGGQVVAHSDGAGRGSEIVITLPAMPAASAPPAADSRGDLAGTPAS